MIAKMDNLVQKLILLLLYCDISWAYNHVYILTSNFFDNINDSNDSKSIRLYFIILTSIGIMFIIVSIIYCLLIYSRNIKTSKKNNFNNEYESLNASFHDAGIQCDDYDNSNLIANKVLNTDIEEQQTNSNAVDNRKKISLRIKTSSRKLHPKTVSLQTT